MTIAALIFVVWWGALVFMWGLCRSAAIGDRQGERFETPQPDLLTLFDRERND